MSCVSHRIGRSLSHERSKLTLWQRTASVFVAVVHCWEISLGQAGPWNVICLSWLILGFSRLRLTNYCQFPRHILFRYSVTTNLKCGESLMILHYAFTAESLVKEFWKCGQHKVMNTSRMFFDSQSRFVLCFGLYATFVSLCAVESNPLLYFLIKILSTFFCFRPW